VPPGFDEDLIASLAAIDEDAACEDCGDEGWEAALAAAHSVDDDFEPAAGHEVWRSPEPNNRKPRRQQHLQQGAFESRVAVSKGSSSGAGCSATAAIGGSKTKQQRSAPSSFGKPPKAPRRAAAAAGSGSSAPADLEVPQEQVFLGRSALQELRKALDQKDKSAGVFTVIKNAQIIAMANCGAVVSETK
jgi:hypothetical protein